MKTSRVLSILLPVVLTAFIAFTGAYALQGCGGGTSDPSGGGDGGEDAGECTPNCDGRECGNDGCGGTCGSGCPTGSPCTAGKCESSGDNCTKVGATCGGGDGCYYDGSGPVCMTAGTKDIGDSCSDINECKAGSTCLDQGGVMNCYGVCPSPNTCTGGGECTDTELGFKVCVSVCNCDTGFKCDTNGACILDPTSMWTLKLTNGTISETDPNGEAWDVPGGMPDVFVCVAVNGTEKCSPAALDTLSPVWNYTFGTFTATALQAGVDISAFDEDPVSDDPICGKGTLPVKDSEFASGTFGASCDPYYTIHFTLTAN